MVHTRRVKKGATNTNAAGTYVKISNAHTHMPSLAIVYMYNVNKVEPAMQRVQARVEG